MLGAREAVTGAAPSQSPKSGGAACRGGCLRFPVASPGWGQGVGQVAAVLPSAWHRV